jgi:hypothetical protein
MSTTRSPRRFRRVAALTALAAIPLVAVCEVGVAAASAHTDTTPVIEIVGNQTHLDMNTTHVRDGYTEIDFRAGDTGEHGLMVMKLQNGATVDGVLQLMASNDIPDALQQVTFVGGTDVVGETETWRMVTKLDPGTYMAADIGQAADESANFSHGAAATFTVDKSSNSPGSPPKNAVTIAAGDNYYKMPATLPQQVVLRFHNVGTQTHAATIVRLNPGVTAEEGLQAALNGDDTNFPGVEVSGVNAFGAGRSDYMIASFQPGTYIMGDFFPDTTTGAPHAAEGQLTSFTVN